MSIVGERIKDFRVMRKLTQKELGIAIGFDESSADVRIAQYESGIRKPKRQILEKMAIVLEIDVNALEFSVENLEYLLFYLDDLEIAEPITNGSDYLILGINTENSKLFEWKNKYKDFKNGKINKDEYLEWKYGKDENSKSV